MSTTVRSLLERRHSVRAFLPEPLPRATVEELLATAQRTASWCNTQPWQVVVTSGEATEAFRTHLRTAVTQVRGSYDITPPAEYTGEYKARRRSSGFALYDALGIEHGDGEARMAQAMLNYEFFGAPHVAILTAPKALGPYGYVDCGGWVSTFLLAAADAGVGAIAQAAIANYSDVVREHLGLPEDRDVVCAISFGPEDTNHPVNAFRTDRAELSETADLRGF